MGLPATPRKQGEPVSALSQQLVFELFQKALPGDTIDKAEGEVGYNKALALFDTGGMSLVARKLLDSLYWYVTERLTAGDEIGPRIDLSLDYLKWLMKFDSKNHAHIERSIRECQRSAMELKNSTGKYVSVPLLGTAGISNNRFVFKLESEVVGLLRDAESRSFLSIRITAGFSSAYAYALYSLLLPSRQAGETGWIPLEDFRQKVGATAKSLDRFGELTRLVIKVAIDQINELSDLHVRHETKAAAGGKKVTHVRFLIRDNDTAAKRLLTSGKTIEASIMEMLRADFGLSDLDLAEIAKNRDIWDSERIIQAASYTKRRMADSKHPIRAPANYLMRALRDGYAIGNLEKEISQAEDPALPGPPRGQEKARESVGARAKGRKPRVAPTQTEDPEATAGAKASPAIERAVEEGEAALSRFRKLSALKQQSVLDEFLASQRRKAGLGLDEVLANRLLKGRFLTFLVGQGRFS